MTNLTIGILGGMGPRATVEFEQRLLNKLEGLDQELPEIITVNDSQIPDRSSFIVASGIDPVPRLLKNAQILAEAGCNIVCMPCNTAHASQILGRLQILIDLPIIDMPAATIKFAEQNSYKQLLILGTEGTKASRVFDERVDNSICIYPNTADQKIINELIAGTKQGKQLEPLMQRLVQVIKAYRVDATILACTELSLISPANKIDQPIIDTLDELVGQCILQMNEYNTVGGRR